MPQGWFAFCLVWKKWTLPKWMVGKLDGYLRRTVKNPKGW